MADEENDWNNEEEAEARSGLYISEGESYKFFKLFYDVRKKLARTAKGKQSEIEVANYRTIGIINQRERRDLFGFEAVGQGYRVLGMDFLADMVETNHENYFHTTISVGGSGRMDVRVINGRGNVQGGKKRRLFGGDK